MYSGTTFRHQSGNVVGVHQRINHVARRHLVHHIGHEPFFPSIKTIQHFEGRNGPDGIKMKSPSIDEPFHYISPDDGAGAPLVGMVEDHMHNLARALQDKDEIRAGFEAAWLAHTIVDGLTPAHQFPFTEAVEELWGKPHHERNSTLDKIVIKGDNIFDTLNKNWQYWGRNGVFTSHYMFEWGVASSIVTSRFDDIGIIDDDLRRVEREGYVPFFLESVRAIDAMGTYQEFIKTGWSMYLATVSRRDMVPLIMKNVCLAWYAAGKGVTR
jgi:hypothetical protein